MSYEKPTSRDIARLIASLSLFVFSIGAFGYLVARFGPNPYAHKGKVSMAELFGGTAEPSRVPSRGQVAGVQAPRFEVAASSFTELKPGKTTIDFARINNVATIRFKGTVFAYAGAFDPAPQTIEDADRYPWRALVDAPGERDRLVGLYTSADSTVIVFVLDRGGQFDLYSYNEYDVDAKLRKINTFSEGSMPNWVPRIAGASTDGRYLNLAMFPCPDCRGAMPVTMLVDSRTGNTKALGQVSEFAWEGGGKYRFKEYKQVECPDKTVASTCAIDPRFLEYKTGALR
jgi:hypothetical protein